MKDFDNLNITIDKVYVFPKTRSPPNIDVYINKTDPVNRVDLWTSNY